ncbi:solute:sodium symporter family transporter [Maribacter polysiphoniae]|uniref:SSS family solute:Na+ symporter n=1 Tax=Maribacter polysiphoniae TaxID=429344 RepID=A0A316DZ36_9FLAO|nr:solute:sodium symporter family transporter [Maribacter polysiphoniae]MBD1262102.1 solute:sodium symporter family transporter [Maribacter polysiphoniae]PWK21793.1 SSS family solute:Na+ symporter [Maribacter polysiphoniae]
MLYTYLGFFGFTLLVIFYTSYKLRKDKFTTSEGYFLAGKSLTGPIIAGSMILTNISTEHLIGMNGSSYENGIIVIAWEVTSAIALVIAAIFFIPKFLKMGLTTIPEFLEKRFDGAIRSIVAFLLMSSFVITLLPIVLYSGAINIESVFDFSHMFGISNEASLVYTVLTIGVIGAFYAVFGGLKAIAYSDSLNGVGLMLGGLLIPAIALYQIGNGDIFNGLSTVYNFAPAKFDIIGKPDSVLPFSVLFTGLMINQLYFWGMNQSIIQRAFGAKNLVEAQKGLIYTGVLKLFVPIIIVLPGLIAFYYFQDQYYETPDLIYPLLVKKVLPTYLYGFFAAIILGAVLSTFNSVLNSASTIFCLDIYKKIIDKDASDAKLVKYGKLSSVILAAIAIIVAPFVAYAPDGLYMLLQELNGIFFIPISSIIIAGIFFKQINTKGAKAGLFFGFTFYILTTFVLEINIHFVHLWGIEFVLNFIIMFLVSRYSTTEKVEVYKEKTTHEKSWSAVNIAGSILVFLTILIYILLS